MNIFTAGSHGVGKTFFCELAAPFVGFHSVSASKLIREEKGTTNWLFDKTTSDIDGNQIALINAVRRRNETGSRLLLDGHFTIRDSQGAIQALPERVFATLRLRGVVLLETTAETLVDRLSARDRRVVTIEEAERAMETERLHAKGVCGNLGLHLVQMTSPTIQDFVGALQSMIRE